MCKYASDKLVNYCYIIISAADYGSFLVNNSALQTIRFQNWRYFIREKKERKKKKNRNKHNHKPQTDKGTRHYYSLSISYIVCLTKYIKYSTKWESRVLFIENKRMTSFWFLSRYFMRCRHWVNWRVTDIWKLGVKESPLKFNSVRDIYGV